MKARFHVVEHKGSTHPLHLHISRGDAHKLFNSQQYENWEARTTVLDSSFIGCIYDSSLENDLFVFINVIEDESKSRQNVEHASSTRALLNRDCECECEYDFTDSGLGDLLDSPVSVKEEPCLTYTDYDECSSNIDIKIDPNYCILSCTQHFINHYSLGPFCDDAELRGDDNVDGKVSGQLMVVIRIPHTYPISRVVIGAKNSIVYKWLKKETFSNGLILLLSEKGKILVRTNDAFLAPYSEIYVNDESFKPTFFLDMQVLECAPFLQGYISVNTEVIITRYHSQQPRLYSDDSFEEDKENDYNLFGDKAHAATFATHKTPVLISDFSSAKVPDSVTKRTNFQDWEQSTGGWKSIPGDNNETERERASGIIEFQPTILHKDFHWSKLLCKEPDSKHFDRFSIIGMAKCLLGKYGLFDGAFVKVAAKTDNKFMEHKQGQLSHSKGSVPRTKVKWHIAQVKMLRKEITPIHEVYVSPLLLFNCSQFPNPDPQPTLQIQKLPETSARCSSSSSLNANLPVAQEVQISIVHSPNYNPNTKFDKILKKYFDVSRILRKGDIIAVPSSGDKELYNMLSADTDSRHSMIYFKVIRIEPSKPEYQDGYVVEKGSGNLIQIGSAHSYVPARMETFVGPSQELSYWERTKLPGLQTYVDELSSIIISHLQISVRSWHNSTESCLPTITMTGPNGCGKKSVARAVARVLGLHVCVVNSQHVTGGHAGAAEAKIKRVFNNVGLVSPCMMILENAELLAKDRDGKTHDPRASKAFRDMLMILQHRGVEHPIIVIAMTAFPQRLCPDLQDSFLHQIHIHPPSETHRREMIRALLIGVTCNSNTDLGYLAQRTAGFVLGDFVHLISQARKVALDRITCTYGHSLGLAEQEDLRSSGVMLEQSDFSTALDKLQEEHSAAIGAPKIPNVLWNDVGGLDSVKSEILDTIQLPLQHPELLTAGFRRSGVLLYGPPGTGKTLMAKAVATECALNFLSVKGPELINKYVGQSEENVREVFIRAQDASPCVVFFDELDSLAPKRGHSGDSGGVMDRVVSQLLTEIDGLHKTSDVFVIGATNRPDLLDTALLRPGRFDKLLYLGVSKDLKSRVQIISALTRKFTLSSDVDIEKLSDLCPENMTGADFYALSSDAMLNAVKRQIQELKSGTLDKSQGLIVRSCDFEQAAENLVPSVSAEELSKFENHALFDH